MAWEDLIRSANKAAKILGKELTEQDIPDSYEELARLNKDLWNQVYGRKAKVGNPIKKSCFLIGAALLRIHEAAELAAWSANKKRIDEADDFIINANMLTAEALAGGFISDNEANELRQKLQSINLSEPEKTQDILADFSVEAVTIALDKVVQCQCKGDDHANDY